MRDFDLPVDFIFANFHRVGIGEDIFDFSDYAADMHGFGVITDCGNFHLLYRRRVYGYDFADKSRVADRAFYGKRILWEVGEMDVETASFGVCLDGIATDVCGANWILRYKIRLRVYSEAFVLTIS